MLRTSTRGHVWPLLVAAAASETLLSGAPRERGVDDGACLLQAPGAGGGAAPGRGAASPGATPAAPARVSPGEIWPSERKADLTIADASSPNTDLRRTEEPIGSVRPEEFLGLSEHARQCTAGQKLVFLHIPKNGGSAVEDLAHDHNVSWGRFMDFHECDLGGRDCHANWHTPPGLMRGIHMYTEASVFCVTRNPYTRAVSEYKYLVGHPEYRWQHSRLIEQEGCSANGLNAFLEDALGKYRSGNPYQHLCHLLPQSYYIWDAPDHEGTQRQWCKEIIRLEDFPTSFNKLMSKYGYSMQMPATGRSNKGSCENLTAAHLSSNVRELLRAVYSDDFKRLHYSSS